MFPNLGDFAENHLEIALEGSEIRTCSKYELAFRRYREKMQEADNTEFADLCGLLIAVCMMYLDPDQTPPLLSFTSDSASPDNLRDDIVEALSNLMSFVDDAELKARIADILWLRNRDYKAGDQAIKAYLTSAQNLENTQDGVLNVTMRVHRAIQIARELNRRNELKIATNYLTDLVSRYGNTSGLQTYLPINVMVIMQHYKFAIDKANEYAALAETGAKIAENNAIWHMARDYWKVKAEWHRLAETEEDYINALLQHAETYVEEALQVAHGDPPQHIAAHKLIEKAITVFRGIKGQQERVKQLQHTLIEYGEKSLDEMEQHSISMDFSSEREQARRAVRGKNLTDALFTLAFLITVPTIEELRQAAKQNIKDAPYRFFASTTFFNAMGKTTARQTSGESDDERIVRAEMQLEAYWHREEYSAKVIGPAIYQIRIEHNIRVQDILPLLTNNPFIPSGHENIYARGLVAGLRDDGLVAAHLLIPQIENSLRYLLMQTGKITSSLDNDLIQDEYLLDTVLYKSEYTLELERILGDSYVFMLKSLLTERPYSNLRNLSAHGLMSYGEFSSYQVVYLSWLTLLLCLSPFVKFDDSGGNH